MYLNINGKNYKLTEVPVTNNNTICNTAPKTISEQKTLTINIKKTSDNAFAIPSSYPADPDNPSVCQHHPEVCTPKASFKGLTINFYDGPDPDGTEEPIKPDPRGSDEKPEPPPERPEPGGSSGGENPGGSSGGENPGGSGSGGATSPAGPGGIGHNIKSIIINYY
ncbi:hypothetical protein CN282_03870 [Bacillus thuringiensis]|uniref:hypothetical protein n=1 Tax=Bacillus thuringiensis TaxID=1428 RepID=UPI000BF2B965|nr:hypothetical protein [Bacillus thuringiensis]PFC56107.1 hypothetical protein CN282_03870 [Bacillus thuringiensis]